MSQSATSINRNRSLVYVALVYFVAFVAAYFVAQYGEAQHFSLLVSYAAADVAATIVVFLGSLVVNNSSVYDPYWSVAPMVLAPAIAAHGEAPLFRKILVISLVLLWGARLTWNCVRGWSGLQHEDFRYVDLRKTTGKAYWLVSFFGLHLMPTVMVYLGCFSIFQALGLSGGTASFWDVLGLLVALGAIYLEARADKELRVFRLTNTVPGKILNTGVWAYCRHPNYLGEILFWWGLFFISIAANGLERWIIIGPISINALFVFVSVPLMTKRALARRPEYKERIERVPALLPRPWRSVIHSDRS